MSMVAEFGPFESSWLFAIVHGRSPWVAVTVAVKQLLQLLLDAIVITGLEDQHAVFVAVQGRLEMA
jgi:hypothetical protein